MVSSGLVSRMVWLAFTDGDSECAAGEVVSESVDICMSLYGCVDVVMLSLGSVCGENNNNKALTLGKVERCCKECMSFLPLDTVSLTSSYVSLTDLSTAHQ